ncbi:MAG: starvation-inducible DNA-binding protein [Planctomycetota bacterium]|jgi:starvation-inducible DNA-binding protein
MTQTVLKNQTSDLKPRLDLIKSDRKLLADALATELADTYRLLINTQGIHWNAQGPLFYSIHSLTEKQYQGLFVAIDDIAERIRALGFPAPQSLTQFEQLASVSDLVVNGELREQILQLVNINETIANHMRDTVKFAGSLGDYRTADLLTQRIGEHEQNVWMLRATVAS